MLMIICAPQKKFPWDLSDVLDYIRNSTAWRKKRENKNRWMELQKRSEKARTFPPPLLEHTIPELYILSKKVSYPSLSEN